MWQEKFIILKAQPYVVTKVGRSIQMKSIKCVLLSFDFFYELLINFLFIICQVTRKLYMTNVQLNYVTVKIWILLRNFNKNNSYFHLSSIKYATLCISFDFSIRSRNPFDRILWIRINRSECSYRRYWNVHLFVFFWALLRLRTCLYTK